MWEAATRTLQFSYTGFAVGGPVPDRVFAATLDPTSNVLTGVVTESSDYTLNGRNWQATRVPFAGMWQGQLGAAGLITLSLTYAEQIWRGRVLRATDWSSLSSIQVTQTGLTATETIVHPGLLSIASSVSGVFGQGSMVVSPWGASLQRLSDGVPF